MKPLSIAERLDEFFFAEMDPTPPVVLRVLLCAVLLIQMLCLSTEVTELFGKLGILQAALHDSFAVSGGTLPLARALENLMQPLGISDTQYVHALCLGYLLSLGALLAGHFPRASAVAAGVTHYLLFGLSHMSSYGVDRFAQSALFYLALSYYAPPRFAWRALQIHLCIAYLATGIFKAMGEQWWNGEAIWRAILMTNDIPFRVLWFAHVPWAAKLACWGTLVIECGYAFAMWTRWRLLWVVLTIALHAGIACELGLYSFSAVMIVLTLCAFALPTEALRPQSRLIPLVSP